MIRQVHQAIPGRSIRHLCDLLEVNRAWYYARPAEEEVADPDVELHDAIEKLVLDFPGYGYRRVTAALHRAGWTVNHKRVLRAMREESLLCQLKRHFMPTTDSHHRHQVYPNQAWVGDITYIRLPSCFVYLACLLDAYSRRCVGWKLSRLIDTNLALGALEMALATRTIEQGLDPPLRSRRAVCQPCLCGEEVYLKQYQTFAEAEANIAHFIEDVYNTKRLHSSHGYLPPVEFEEAYVLNSRV